MASAVQVTANQANAQFSTGPRTAAGKAASSRNRISHGLFASIESFCPEDRVIFDRSLAHHTEDWEPNTPELDYWVTKLALADFRIDRVMALERGIYNYGVAKFREEGATDGRITLEARLFLEDCKSAKAISRLHRWERAFLRDRQKAVDMLSLIMEHEEEGEDGDNDPPPASTKSAITNPIPPLTPRSAPCPCGSGEKFKRCCGKDAPPVLFPLARP